MDSFVFADEARAIRTNQLHRALFRSKTWADLKAAVHPDEYEFIVYKYYDYNDELAETELTGEINWEFCDKDSYMGAIYPAFLIYEMENIIPEDVLKSFGSDEIITDYGSYRQIKPDKLVPMISALTARGYEVAPAGNLIFDDFYTEDDL